LKLKEKGYSMYLDPGSGSLLIQLLLGALLAIGIVVRMSWKKIRTWFGGKKDSAETSATAPEDADETN
jgi:hypothetical protein